MYRKQPLVRPQESLRRVLIVFVCVPYRSDDDRIFLDPQSLTIRIKPEEIKLPDDPQASHRQSSVPHDLPAVLYANNIRKYELAVTGSVFKFLKDQPGSHEPFSHFHKVCLCNNQRFIHRFGLTVMFGVRF